MQCLQFYAQFVHNQSMLAQGHSLISAFLLHSQANRQATLFNLFVDNPPILTLVSHVYACDVYSLLHDDEKIKTRQFFIEALWKMISNGMKNKKVQGLLGMIRKMHNEEGYEQWLTLYAHMLQNTPQQHQVQLIIGILQECDSRISPLSTQIFEYVALQGQKLHARPEQLLQIFYYCVRSFSHLAGTDDATLQKFYEPYEQKLLAIIWSNLQSNPLSMKYSLKILTIVYGDMNRFGQNDEKIVPKIMLLGAQLAQEYLKRLNTLNFMNLSIDEDQNLQTQSNIQTQIPYIVYQFLELCDILLENSEEHPIQQPILLITLQLAISPQSQLFNWSQNSDQYLTSIQDEFQRSLRNRCTTMLVKLIEDVDNKVIVREDLRAYFGAVSNMVENGNVSDIQEYFNRRNTTGFAMVLPNNTFSIEESSYFLLASVLQVLYPSPQPLLHYLCNRFKASSSVLLKIGAVFILQNQLHGNHQFLIKFIVQCCNQQTSIYQNSSNIGLALVLAKGIGKIIPSYPVLIGQNLKPQFLAILTNYLITSREAKPDQDATHIVLELYLRLTEKNQNNKSLLSNFITPELQTHMVNHYMHDGLLSSIVLKLLECYPHQQTISVLFNTLMEGKTVQQKYCQLVAKWITCQALSIEPVHIERMLEAYNGNKRQILCPILKVYLKLSEQKSGLITPKIDKLLNDNTPEVLLAPMIKSRALHNITPKVIACATDIAYVETSQFEIERKMTVLFYIGITQTANLPIIFSGQEKVFQALLEKVLKYSPLFQGEHLRLINSIWLFKLVELNPFLKNQVMAVINSYGNLQVNEWEEEEEEQEGEEQDIFQKLMNCKLENQETQKELYEIFGEYIDGGTGITYIEFKKKQYS